MRKNFTDKPVLPQNVRTAIAIAKPWRQAPTTASLGNL